MPGPAIPCGGTDPEYVAEAARYEIAKAGTGFVDAAPRRLPWALFGLRVRLRRVAGPYTIQNPETDAGPGPQRNRPDTLDRVHERIAQAPVGTRLIIRSATQYDAPAYVIRKVAVVPLHPLVDAAMRYLHEGYSLGAIPPPLADCSGLTLKVADEVYHVTLPHRAMDQAVDPHIRRYGDRDNLEPDDFIFYVYPGRTDLPAGAISHVSLNIDGHNEISARPSLHGVGISPIDWDNVVGFGRLQP